jgi:hypothetical protein
MLNNNVSRDECSDSFMVYGVADLDGDGVDDPCFDDGSGYFSFAWTGGCVAQTLEYSAGSQDLSAQGYNEGFIFYGFEPGITETFVMTFDSNSTGAAEATNACATCEELGQITCWDGSCAANEAACPEEGECAAGYIIDCVDLDCCLESWIGDGYEDCADQQYGCDLTCYDNDGGDCPEPCDNFTCWDGSCVASEADCPDIGDQLVDCAGNVWDNSNTQFTGDADNDGDGCTDTVYDCVIDDGTCQDIAGCCLDANGTPTGLYDCPDGVIGAWTNDSLCDDGDFGLYANCEAFCFDDGACGITPPDDCTIGDSGPSCETAGTGDVNMDGASNILDIVSIVNYILNISELDHCEILSGDLNADDTVNVLDIIAIVNIILDGRAADASSARLIDEAGVVSIDADGYVGAVQMTLTHGADFSINLTNDAMVAEYATKGNTTTLVVVAPERDQIFTSNGEFEITEMIVANSLNEINVVMATEFSLMAAYPNPFNPSTTLSLNMPESGFVSVKVFNLMGKAVATLAEGSMDANTYSFTWNASDMPSGMYMVRAEAMGQVSSQKLMLLK